MSERRPAVLGRDDGPWEGVECCLVLSPHPDDFEVVAVTMQRLAAKGTEMCLEVLTSGASGVEDCFAATWDEKADAREGEQRESGKLFGLDEEKIRFHRLVEDEEGHMLEDEFNEGLVRAILDRVKADVVVLPHGSDTNADHRRTFRIFDRWAKEQKDPPVALLVRDPKTTGMRLDLVTVFGKDEAEWKGELLRCHASQQERGMKTRGYGLDERILRVNREIAEELGGVAKYAEGFEVKDYAEES